MPTHLTPENREASPFLVTCLLIEMNIYLKVEMNVQQNKSSLTCSHKYNEVSEMGKSVEHTAFS